MTNETGKVTFQGNPLTLIGQRLEVGDKFPEIALIGNDLSPINITDTKGIKIIAAVPSLDTPVCDTEVRKFNKTATELANVSIFAISADLPFAQGRWCGSAGIDKVTTASDHKDMALADALGIHIKELRLFARAVLVVDVSNTVVYKEIIGEVTDEPDYAAALEAVKKC